MFVHILISPSLYNDSRATLGLLQLNYTSVQTRNFGICTYVANYNCDIMQGFNGSAANNNEITNNDVPISRPGQYNYPGDKSKAVAGVIFHIDKNGYGTEDVDTTLPEIRLDNLENDCG